MKSYIEEIWNECKELKWLRCRWDYLKYKIKEKSRTYGMTCARVRRQRIVEVERKLKLLEQSHCETSDTYYVELKHELDMFYHERVESLATQAKCDAYEHGE